MKLSACMKPALLTLVGLLGACASLSARESAYAVHPGQVFAQPGGKPLKADLYVPDGAGRFPGVLLIHGGGWKGGEPADMNRFARELAGAGFTVMNTSYRLAPEAIHPAQVEDVRSALRWFRQHAEDYKLNPDQVAAFGYSAGAHLALMLGVQPAAGAEVQAVVAGAGPTDLRKYPDSPLVNTYLGGPPEGRQAQYADASPIVHVSRGDAPTYLYHGKRDGLVEVEQSLDMAAALEKAGVPVVMDVQPFGHVLTFFMDREVMQGAVAFLREKLGG